MRPPAAAVSVLCAATALFTGAALGTTRQRTSRGDGDCSLEGSVRVNGTFSDALFQATVSSQSQVLWIVSYDRWVGGALRSPAAVARANASAKIWVAAAAAADDDYRDSVSATGARYGWWCADDRSAGGGEAAAQSAGYTSYDLTSCTVNYTHPWESVVCAHLLLYPHEDGTRLRFGLSVCDAADASTLTYHVIVSNAYYVSACPSDSPAALAVGAVLVAAGAVLLAVCLRYALRYHRVAAGGGAAVGE